MVPGILRLVLTLVLVGTMPLARGGARSEPPEELAILLERAAAYVDQYRETFLQVIADEQYVQEVERRTREGPEPFLERWQPAERRELTSELVFVRLAGDIQWTAFRDVRSVDGRELPDRDHHVGQLLRSDATDRPGLIRRLLQASARHHLGPIIRDFNDPLLPLLFLSREHRHRFRFQSRGEVDALDVRVVRIGYEETFQPTLIQRSGEDEPSRGELWIQPATGAVVRSEHELGRRRDPRAHVTIMYRRDPRLRVWVPDTMREVYTHSGGYRVTGTATYTSFRRFDVESRVLKPPSW